MRILIINPNSDEQMSRQIAAEARAFSGGEYQVDCICAEGAPAFIETYGDIQQAAAGMTAALSRHMEDYDAFVVGCGYDPNLDLMKEMTVKPVVGMGEASFKVASMLGHRFTILSTDEHSIPIKEDLAFKYGMKPFLASVRIVPLEGELRAGGEDGGELAYERACQQAVQQDRAEVIVLGCAGLSGMDKKLEKAAGVPVLDGVKCALIVAAGLAKYKVSISKIRKYSLYYETEK